MNYNETFFNMMVYYFFAKGVFELSVSIKNEIIGGQESLQIQPLGWFYFPVIYIFGAFT